MYCTAGREHVAYTLEATRDKIGTLEKFLHDACVNQQFKPWELEDHLPRLKLDRINRPAEVRVLERLHKAAYRRGLGNSLYSPKFMVGKHSTELMKEHVDSNFTEASVVALGMPHDQVVAFANQLNLKSAGSRTVEPSKFYYGGEIRKESGEELAYVTIGFEGAPLSKPKDVIAAALVHRALGVGARTKRGMNPGGKLDTVSRNTPKESLAAGFSASYTDSGIVGAYLVASSCCIEQATRKAAEVLRSANFTEDEANRAKAMLKTDVGLALDTDAGLLDDMGLQSLFSKQVVSSSELLNQIESAKAGDMNSILKNGGGKFVMAAYGNIANVPYLDELK
jgi:ubiquinol-cytochrome c reductase core subunit 2